MDFVDFNTESMIQGRVDGLSAGTSFFCIQLFLNTRFSSRGDT